MGKQTWIGMIAMVASGCSMVEVKQEPFPPMQVTAERPAPPPEPPPEPARVVLTDSAIEIKEKVQFELGKAEIREESHALLDEVAKVLKDNPQIELLQVEGHTDSTGGIKINKKLSNGRAEAVRAYLVTAGVDGNRLKAIGFGPDRPLVENDTPENQETNRRVEFNIVKQGKKQVVVEDKGGE